MKYWKNTFKYKIYISQYYELRIESSIRQKEKMKVPLTRISNARTCKSIENFEICYIEDKTLLESP